MRTNPSLEGAGAEWPFQVKQHRRALWWEVRPKFPGVGTEVRGGRVVSAVPILTDTRCIRKMVADGVLWMRLNNVHGFLQSTLIVAAGSEEGWEHVSVAWENWFTLYASLWLSPVMLKIRVLETSDGRCALPLISHLFPMAADAVFPLIPLCVLARPARSSRGRAGVCLLRTAARGLRRWLRRTQEGLLISRHVKTFCQANAAWRRLRFGV